jgi:hypothetical protein
MILMSLSFGSYANIMEKVFVNSMEENTLKSVINTMYKEEISTKNSVIKGQVLGLLSYAQEDEVVFITDDNFDVSDDDFFDEKVYIEDPILVSSGKSGAAYHHASFIVPIVVASPGTGMFQKTVAYIQVDVETSFYDMETESDDLVETYTFTKLATLKDL